ncbi:unnamed protein product [Durusdinium trenchii]|uniref:Membrane transporter protein n=1 Tax=Durusdinium trenchii TaxID=1381693 RepID=A0ABP0J1Q8_9DINO
MVGEKPCFSSLHAALHIAMNPGTALVVVTGCMFGAFVRAATGFGGSILFVLVYSFCGQFQVAPDLDSALLMVLLGTVFELTCSPVLFAAISRKAFSLWRCQLLLFLGCLPGTALGMYLLLQSTANREILQVTKTALNLIFFLVAMYRLTVEFRIATPAEESAEKPDKELCRTMGLEFILLGFGSGFLNGLLGLPGPLMMVYFATVLSAGRLNGKTCFILSQSFFLVTAFMRLTSLNSLEAQEMLMQHWQLAAIIPIPTLLALWGGWREGKRFNTKALLRSVLVLLLVSSIMGLGLFQASVLSIVAGSLALVWLPLVLIRHWLAHPLKDLSHGGEEAAPRGGSPEEEAAVAAYTAEVQAVIQRLGVRRYPMFIITPGSGRPHQVYFPHGFAAELSMGLPQPLQRHDLGAWSRFGRRR